MGHSQLYSKYFLTAAQCNSVQLPTQRIKTYEFK